MKHSAHTLQRDTDPRPFAFTDFSTECVEKTFNMIPQDVRSNWIFKDSC